MNVAVSMGKCLGNRLKPVKIICLDLVDLSTEAMQITSKSWNRMAAGQGEGKRLIRKKWEED